MTNDLMPFTSLAEMLDAVLEALPPGPETINLASPGEKRKHELLVRAFEEIRQERSYAFDSFDLNAEAFWKIAEQGERAFAAGALGLPTPMFVGLMTLTAEGGSASTIVMAEELPQAEHGLPTADPVLFVCAAQPMRCSDRGEVEFVWVSSALFVALVEGMAVGVPVEQPIDECKTVRIPMWALFVMLTLLADDHTAIRRTVAPVEVNAARARRGQPLIPPMWTVSGGDLIELYATGVEPKQPRN